MIRFPNAANRASDFRLHPLGFFYLQETIAAGEHLRVHVWLNEHIIDADNDYHTHSYDIESNALLGRMQSELYEFSVHPEGQSAEYVVRYESEKSFLIPTGNRGDLRLIAQFETQRGASYKLCAGTIHRVIVLERPCITVVKTIERNIPILSYGVSEEQAFNRRSCTPVEAMLIRQHLLATES